MKKWGGKTKRCTWLLSPRRYAKEELRNPCIGEKLPNLVGSWVGKLRDQLMKNLLNSIRKWGEKPKNCYYVQPSSLKGILRKNSEIMKNLQALLENCGRKLEGPCLNFNSDSSAKADSEVM